MTNFDRAIRGAATIPAREPRAVFHIAIVLAASLLFTGGVNQTVADDAVADVTLTPAAPDQPVTVRDRLIAGLQARLQSEVTFIDHVLAQVEAGHIPQQMVDETFFWARKKAADPRHVRPQRPIIYFEPAMLARANALNVTL